MTVIVDLDRGVPLDIVEGRSKAVLAGWLAAQTPTWRAAVKVATLDPAALYRAALTDPTHGLRNATLVLDQLPRGQAGQHRHRRLPSPGAERDPRASGSHR